MRHVFYYWISRSHKELYSHTEEENGMPNENETKKCKHCQTEIPKKAKVCPNCHKKQGGIVKWIVIVVAVIVVIGAIASGGDNQNKGSDSNPTKKGESQNTSSSNTDTEDNSGAEGNTQEPINNKFVVGDIVETSDLTITYLSAGQYTSDNEFLQPKNGYVYYRMEFEFENIGNSDEFVSSFDFECYADGYAADQTYIGDDGLSATLSPSKKAKGAVYYEIPADAQEITLEYKVNYWTEDKVIFVVK